jgi:predicted DNA-binding transcriptional regulator YafY
MAVDKLERQLGLLAALLHTERPLRASEIHERVEGYPEDNVAFRRAFERDKDDLRRLGIPLNVERTESATGPIDGYRVSQGDYYLHDLGLEPDEVVALSVALRLIRLEGVAADDALWKLGGASSDQAGSAQLAQISMGPAVTQFHEAITSQAAVTFDYKGEQRQVEPWRLAFRRGQWYLEAFDRVRADERRFRLDRIEGAVQVDEPGTATTPRVATSGERQPWQFTTEDEQSYTARVAIDASHARWAQHHLPAATVVETHSDGSIEIELEVTNIAAFRSLVLSMFEVAEILSPPELRADMIQWLETIVTP